MNTFKYLFCFMLIVHAELHGYGQDSLKTLSVPQLTRIVRQYHPVALQTNLRIGMAGADLISAKGAFDPVFRNETADKTFDGQQYYYYNRSELSLPSWFGIEVNAGMEYLSGDRTDPSDTKGKSSYLGLSIPLARDLLMDKRRAVLQTAKIMREASETEQQQTLNQLLYDAIKAYWRWTEKFQVYSLMEEAVKVNRIRLQGVTNAWRMGDRPAIDTTEALAQLQQFELNRSEAWLDFQNAGLELSVYLWTENRQPYWLPDSVIPADNLKDTSVYSVPAPDLTSLLASARQSNPELRLYDFKLDALTIERKLRFQELLPGIRFQYNQLGKGHDLWKTAKQSLLANNFRYGISVGIPLRFSEGRGQFRKTKLQIRETQLEQTLKQQQVLATVKSVYNEWLALRDQVQLQEKAYRSFLQLQRGEETRLAAGESSLFLVNSRESRTIESLKKLQELKAKFFTTGYALQWAAGLLAI